jgi:hypothetical protein
MAVLHVAQDSRSRRLSLPSFVAAGDSPTEVRTDLDRWVADHLVVIYSVNPAIADALVASGWLLPIFDGQDELDPEHVVAPEAVPRPHGVRTTGHRPADSLQAPSR